MITREEAIAQFKQIIGQQSSWARIATSQFVEHLAVFVSWCLREALWRIERLNQEFFISTALNKSSILAHAEDREYVPRKRVPSSGTIRVTNNGPATVALPIYTVFESSAQLSYVTTQAVVIAAAAYADVPVEQKTAYTLETRASAEKAFYEVLLPKEDSDKLASFTVEVNQGDGFTPWAYARLFQNAYSYSQVYDEFYNHMGQTGVRFGNGIFGQKPLLNAGIKVEYWLTEGATTLLSGQPLDIVGEVLDNAGNPVDLLVVSQTILDGGGEAEDIEEIRTNLHYWPTYNGKLVWDNDYEFYIRKNLANITWVNCWGEQEQEAVTGFDVQNINKIFVSAYATGNIGLEADVMAKLGEIHFLNRKFEWVDPVDNTFTLTVTGKVGRSVVISEAAAAIEAALIAAYGKDSADRRKEVFTSDFYDIVNETGYFLENKANFTVALAGDTTSNGLSDFVYLLSATVNLEYV